jgi:uncharacterized protein YndB with AHSA1/START domain
VIPSTSPFTLTLERTLAAPRKAIWQCWTEADLVEQWFCPKPWFVKDVDLDVRAGGASSMTMCGPNGETVPNKFVYLALEEGKRLVFTDAFTSAWIPSGKAFVVCEILLADALDGQTHYIARVHHWNEADMQEHVKMGFHEGWGTAADQLEALAKTL